MMLKAVDGRSQTGINHQKDVCRSSPDTAGYVKAYEAIEQIITVCAVFREPKWSQATRDEKVAAIRFCMPKMKTADWPAGVVKLIHEDKAKLYQAEKAWKKACVCVEPFAVATEIDLLEPRISCIHSNETTKIATASRMWFKDVVIPYIRADVQGERVLLDIVEATQETMDETFDLYTASPVLKGCARDWQQALNMCKLVLDNTTGVEYEDRAFKLIIVSFI